MFRVTGIIATKKDQQGSSSTWTGQGAQPLCCGREAGRSGPRESGNGMHGKEERIPRLSLSTRQQLQCWFSPLLNAILNNLWLHPLTAEMFTRAVKAHQQTQPCVSAPPCQLDCRLGQHGALVPAGLPFSGVAGDREYGGYPLSR